MTWSTFYLFCFAVGFLFSVVPLVAGGFHLHLPGSHAPAVGHHVHVHVHGAHGTRGSGVSPFNSVTLAAFLAWFGGVGYLLTRYSGVWVVLVLAIAVASGGLGAALLFLFLTRVLMSTDESLDPADFVMTGVLGRVSSPIREGGTGEIIYSQGGTRRACGARSDTGQIIPTDTDVIVTRFEHGIAYVHRWKDLADD
jgi:membrane protein implicated in regulation of membrane protease activity